jgi:protein involved in polysaccharide export with SLBB domain
MSESKKSCFRICLSAALLMSAFCGGTATAQQNTQSVASDYRIGPGDTLKITVAKHPELSADAIEVRPSGYTRLPMFHEEQALGVGTNDVAAAGLSAEELGRVLSRKIEHETTVVVKEVRPHKPLKTVPVKTEPKPNSNSSPGQE